MQALTSLVVAPNHPTAARKLPLLSPDKRSYQRAEHLQCKALEARDTLNDTLKLAKHPITG
jgi:hypothetical protein